MAHGLWDCNNLGHSIFPFVPVVTNLDAGVEEKIIEHAREDCFLFLDMFLNNRTCEKENWNMLLTRPFHLLDTRIASFFTLPNFFYFYLNNKFELRWLALSFVA